MIQFVTKNIGQADHLSRVIVEIIDEEVAERMGRFTNSGWERNKTALESHELKVNEFVWTFEREIRQL